MAESPTTEREIHQLACIEIESDPKLRRNTMQNAARVFGEAPNELSDWLRNEGLLF